MTQRDIARAAGVTPQTVSLALKGDPSIPATTRDRLRRIAKERGYVADPVLSALSAYRWPSSANRRARVEIAVVNLRRDRRELAGYDDEIFQGVAERARALGFVVTLISLVDYDGDLKRAVQSLRDRGISGLILLPPGQMTLLDPDVAWEGLSVVAATTSVIVPRFHQVVPNQVHNMTLLLEKMRGLGHRRIGAIFSEDFEERTTHAYSVALAWHGHRDRVLILSRRHTASENRRRILAWLKRHRPDCVFAPNVDEAERVIRDTRHRPRIVQLGNTIDQLPKLIGESALRTLSGMLHTRETGVPPHARITTIDSVIRDTPRG